MFSSGMRMPGTATRLPTNGSVTTRRAARSLSPRTRRIRPPNQRSPPRLPGRRRRPSPMTALPSRLPRVGRCMSPSPESPMRRCGMPLRSRASSGPPRRRHGMPRMTRPGLPSSSGKPLATWFSMPRPCGRSSTTLPPLNGWTRCWKRPTRSARHGMRSTGFLRSLLNLLLMPTLTTGSGRSCVPATRPSSVGTAMKSPSLPAQATPPSLPRMGGSFSTSGSTSAGMQSITWLMLPGTVGIRWRMPLLRPRKPHLPWRRWRGLLPPRRSPMPLSGII